MSVRFVFHPARAEDLDELVALRIEAMRESLTALGRFDPARARERFANGFDPAHTRHVVVEGARVGFVVVKAQGEGLLLDHFYLRPAAQGRGLGGVVLSQILADADAQGLPLAVGALRGSRANRFYARHGFLVVGQSEWDVYYRRDACSSARS